MSLSPDPSPVGSSYLCTNLIHNSTQIAFNPTIFNAHSNKLIQYVNINLAIKFYLLTHAANNINANSVINNRTDLFINLRKCNRNEIDAII